MGIESLPKVEIVFVLIYQAERLIVSCYLTMQQFSL